MPDFEEMYYTLMRASEEALRIIIEAQKSARICISHKKKSNRKRRPKGRL